MKSLNSTPGMPDKNAPTSQIEEGRDAVSQPKRFYRPELDWLRFIAFSAVFLLHAFPSDASEYMALGLPRIVVENVILPLVHAGGWGVDLFFALSAFLITELLLREKENTGRVHVNSFYIRRILRIWPLYITYIALIAAYEIPVKAFPALYFIALLGFVGNWYIAIMGGINSLCGHLWSVCIEEQFYIVWPNLVGRIRTKWFAIVLLAIFCLTCLYRVFYLFDPPGDSSTNVVLVVWSVIDALCGSPAFPYSVWYTTFTRLDGFALGGLLACILHNRRVILPLAARAIIFLAGVAIYWVLGNTPYGGEFGSITVWTYPVAACGCVLCILAFVSAPPRNELSSPLRALSYLGKISYGLYVYHLIAIKLAEHGLIAGTVAENWLWVARVISAAIMTLVASMISYAVLEMPFLRMKRRFTFVASRPE